MYFELFSNIDQVDARYQRIRAAVSEYLPSLLMALGEMSRVAVRMRIIKGVDLDEYPFKPYSENPLRVVNSPYVDGNGFYEGGYRQYKLLMKGSDRVDLNLTGEMLTAFRPEQISSDRVMVHFVSEEARQKAVENQETHGRSFVGLTDTEVIKISEYAADKLMEVAQNAWNG